MGQELTIEDLSEQSGLSLRTLRYYISEGLLPGPDTAGKYASYSQQHVDHLEIIQRLKRLHLPLKEIRLLLANMTRNEMRQILEYQDSVAENLQGTKKNAPLFQSNSESTSSAMEYIHDLENRHNRLQSLADSSSMPASPQQRTGGVLENRSVQESAQNYKTTVERWTKIILIKGIELNVKEKQSLKYKKEVDALIKFAAKLFGSRSKGGSKK